MVRESESKYVTVTSMLLWLDHTPGYGPKTGREPREG